MLALIQKILLLALCALHLGENPGTGEIAAMLTAFTVSALSQYAGRRPVTWALWGACALACPAWPALCIFLPLTCFDLPEVETPRPVLAAAPLLIWLRWGDAPRTAAALTVMCLLAALLQYTWARILVLTADMRAIRDDSAELAMALEERNRALIEKQDTALGLATLRERNRIAREIHDSVGHMLSRSLLQTGAIQSLNRDAALDGQLTGLRETLDQAMDSIRRSVHDLRDDPQDLYTSIEELTRPFRGKYTIDLDYDIEDSVPPEVKYCILTVVQEAVTNTAKHSDATEIRIRAQEHPAMYQLTIRDNGTPPRHIRPGMGLTNIQERVSALGGRFDMGTEGGFRLFITIPKPAGGGEGRK